ncbi:uncharacterized protein LOC117296328 [Asterias rubens]|uniref:uncharacterized protein LOC117296328 n=1 Tax=Asterias rubens TaxID=7604 RepID=UPI0014557BD3|nr:uncharacterized protein LOC117296328 [Asterias rubens]
MLRFLAITVAVCSLFVQDAQATAVASNTRREIELEEELLRALETERTVPPACLQITEEVCIQSACYYVMSSPCSEDTIFAEVNYTNGEAFFAVDVETDRVFKETVPDYNVDSAHTSDSFVLCDNGKNYQVTVSEIILGNEDTSIKINKFCMLERLDESISWSELQEVLRAGYHRPPRG